MVSAEFSRFLLPGVDIQEENTGKDNRRESQRRSSNLNLALTMIIRKFYSNQKSLAKDRNLLFFFSSITNKFGQLAYYKQYDINFSENEKTSVVSGMSSIMIIFSFSVFCLHLTFHYSRLLRSKKRLFSIFQQFEVTFVKL